MASGYGLLKQAPLCLQNKADSVGSYELDVAAHEGDEVVLKVAGVIGGQATHPDPMTTFEAVLDLSVGGLPLTAEAGGPYSGTEGESIALSGSASGGTSPYHTYPVLQVWAYYNDIYYLDSRAGSGNAPASWH